MKKLLIIGLIGAAALAVVAKKTHVCSYASTLVSEVSKETKQQIPPRFELERIRNEIAGLDTDISQMVRPIAEYKVAIDKLRKDITKTQTNVDAQKKNLLVIVEELAGNPKTVTIGERTYTVARVRAQLQRDTASVKQLERTVKTQQQVLEAKEGSLRATQEQLAKVIAKKREYELRLAQLEAEEETLQIARIGSDIKIDSSRATQIETALSDLEQRQDVERKVIEMRTGDVANIPLQERVTAGPFDLQTIRNYLEGAEPTDKTASNK